MQRVFLHSALVAVLCVVITAANVSLRGITLRSVTVGSHGTTLRPAPSQDEPLHGAKLAIVAAHHEEDLAWLDSVAQRCGNCHVYVYTSSPEQARRTFQHGTVREVPNVGREWGKYLRFIVDEYQALERTSATVLFVHAHEGSNGSDDHDRGNVSSVVPYWPESSVNHILFLHGYPMGVTTGRADPLDYGLLIRNIWPELFSELGKVPQLLEDTDLDLYSVSSAEFSVPARQIVDKSLHFYQRLDQWLTSRKPVVGTTPEQDTQGDFYAVSFDYAAGSILELLTWRIFQGVKPLSAEDGMSAFITPKMLRPS